MSLTLRHLAIRKDKSLTNDECTRHATLAACYQLAESVLKIGFTLAKKGGIGGGGWVSAQGAVHMAATLAGYNLGGTG